MFVPYYLLLFCLDFSIFLYNHWFFLHHCMSSPPFLSQFDLAYSFSSFKYLLCLCFFIYLRFPHIISCFPSCCFSFLTMDFSYQLTPPSPPLYSKNDEFYTPPRSRPMETAFLSLLASECYHGHWEVANYLNNFSIISTVHFHAILHYGPSNNVPKRFYDIKYVEWSRRFHLLRWLLTCSFLCYDERNNRLPGSQQVSRDLVNVNPLVFYYQHEGEFNWSYLCLLFKPASLSFWSSPTPTLTHNSTVILGSRLPIEESQATPSNGDSPPLLSL